MTGYFNCKNSLIQLNEQAFKYSTPGFIGDNPGMDDCR